MRRSSEQRAIVATFVAFALATVGALGFAVAYARDAATFWYGITLFVAFGGLGYGLVAWAHRLMPTGGRSEVRHHLRVPRDDEDRAAEAIGEGTAGVSRRRLLGGAFAGALGMTGVALLFPLGSLGPPPHEALRRTAWSRAPLPRVVDESGRALRPGDLAVGEVLTVFPAEHIGAADAQTLLIRLPDDAPLEPPTREDWIVEGLVAYSKVCTHAGCPVGLYVAEQQELFCPCHQSAFAVLSGAIPTIGPAVRALPQLPLEVDADGYLVAGGDFPEAVGPGWWSRP